MITQDLHDVDVELKKINKKIKFSEDIEPDIYNLEIEWLRQSMLAFVYSKYVALLQKKHDLLEIDLSIASADADKKARKVLVKDGKAPTETQVKHYVTKKIAGKTAAIANVKYRIRIANGAFDAIRTHKKKALEKVTELYLSNYYGEPTLRSEEAKKAFQQQIEAAKVEKRSQSLKGMKKKLKEVKGKS